MSEQPTPAGVRAAHLAVARAVHDEVHDAVHAYHQTRGGLEPGEHWPTLCLNNCGDVADELARRFADDGRTVEDGTYAGPGRPSGDRSHAGNRLVDGTIVDATADQYGHDPVLVVPAGDPRQAWYEPAAAER